MSSKKRYAHIGHGSRSRMFVDAIYGDFKQYAEMVAICDINKGRLDLANKYIGTLGGAPVVTYRADEFDKMIAETKPDTVIITTGPDATHSDYIIRAMELGCDVITEKPMTTDDEKCRRILDTRAATGRKIQVTFNYRYSPPRSQIRQMIMDDAIGEILSVDFGYMLDTRHGADYFRRWHRQRANSGSLLVHKSTHHFDLINWFLDDMPEQVFCHASHKYYKPETAERMGLTNRGQRCHGCAEKDNCKFYMEIEDGELLQDMYLNCEDEEYSYVRDKCVFSDEINIWDNMSISVRYKRGALLNYMLHSYCPYEGYRIAFNGTKGRIEHMCCENTYVSGDGTVPGELKKENVSTTLIPEFEAPQIIEVATGEGGHGGGDPILLTDIFHPDPPVDALKRKAGQKDGTYSILIGVAACKSIDTGSAINIEDLIAGSPLE